MSKPQEPPPTSATKIITLLEQQKIQQGDNNGTYSINLKHPIVLSNGDSINLKKDLSTHRHKTVILSV